MAVCGPLTPAHPSLMKVLIILATALLVPVMMKFQARSILERSNPKTAQEITQLLTEGGVANPQVSIHYREATIGGKVASEEDAHFLVSKVEALRGVGQVVNQLVVQGWFKIDRQRGGLVASGVVTSEWREEVLSGQPGMEVAELKTRDHLRLAGRSAVSWGLFLDQFFQLPGAKTLTFLDGELTLEGEALPSEMEKLRQASPSLGADVAIDLRLTEIASRFHLSERSFESPIDGESRRRLTRQLSEKKLPFEEESSALSKAGQRTLSELALRMREAPSAVKFVVGCYPDAQGADLATQRAQAAKAALVKAGVDGKRLTVIAFEKTENEDQISGQVELLIH